MMRIDRPFALLSLLALATCPAFAASNLKVAAVGDGAPDGGVFAGPSFTAWPTAAGDGWIAFRSQLEGGSASEAIIAAHLTAPLTRVQIARIGQKVDGAGTIRDFLGSPGVSPLGDVAFFANYRRDDGSQHAALFFYDHAAPISSDALHRVVDDGDISDAGVVSFARRVEPGVDATSDDTADRTVSVNAAGAVVFVAGTDADDNTGSAVFRYTRDAGLEVVARKGDTAGTGTFVGFGSPAVNTSGQIAFRGLSTDSDGIFVYTGGTVVRRVGRNQEVSAAQSVGDPYVGTLIDFGNALTLNDSGDIAFTAGPLTDATAPAPGPCASANPEFGVCVYHGGTTSLVAFPGQALGAGRVTSVRLGANGGSLLPPPAVANDGTVSFSVEISDGAIEVLRKVKKPYGLNNTDSPVVFGGQGSTPDPTGGRYRAVASATVVDASGALTFFARLAGGTTSEAVVYLPTAGSPSVITQGEPSPNSGSGYFSGPAFSGPAVTDAGDVIFKAFVARGRTSVGIFKTHFEQTGGQFVRTTTRLVGANDLIPDGSATIVDIVGDPDVAGDGTVSFAALADNNHGRGIYRILADGTVSLVADRTVSAPGAATFSSVGLTPAINRGGTVAFRSAVKPTDPNLPSNDGIFLFGSNGFTTQLMNGDTAAAGTFSRLRDPAISAVPSIAFRGDIADPGNACVGKGGMFLADGTGVVALARQGDEIGNGIVIGDFSGSPTMSDDGDVAFLVSRLQDGTAIGSALLSSRNEELAQVVAVGSPGPAGGTFKSISAPAMAPKGRLAFRGSIEGGGPGGLFVNGDSGIRPYVLTNDTSPIGGRFSSFGTKLSLDVKDDLAFTATVSGGDARSGVFVASPTVLLAPAFNLKLSGGQKRDRLNLSLTLALGRLATDLDPVKEAITVTVSDGTGTLQQFRIPSGTLEKRGKRFVVASGKTLPEGLRKLRVVAGRRKTYRVMAKTGPLDLTLAGTRRISTPLSVSLEIGDDAGTFISRCQLRLNGAHCGSN